MREARRDVDQRRKKRERRTEKRGRKDWKETVRAKK